MNNILHRIFAAFIALTIIAGCSSKEEQPATCVEVTILFSNEGFCGFGYNDVILKAIETVSSKYGFEYSFFVPDSLEHGINHYKEWLKKDPKEETRKSLFIFASGNYADLLDKEEHPAADSKKEILLFEIEKELPYAYTFAMSYFGPSYLISSLIIGARDDSFLTRDMEFCVMAANPYIDGVDYVIDGIQTSIDEFDFGYINRVNVSLQPDSGLNMQDIAYMLCGVEDINNPDCMRIFYPFAGNSNMGIYRYSQLHFDIAIGMDSTEFQGSLIFYYMIKRMDLALDDFFSLWLKNKEIPRHTFYTMESGRVDVEYAEVMKVSKEMRDSLRNVAIGKEKEYFESRKDR